MERKRKLLLAKGAVVLAAVPVLIYAYEYGPDAGLAGVPGEAGNCNQAGCHTGTGVNAGGGSVSVTFPNGMSYTPGTKQHVVVTITDSAMKRWGFELTARTQSDTTQMAGSFTPTDKLTQLICDTASDLGVWTKEKNSSTACPDGLPLAYIEQTLTGFNTSQDSPGKYEFDWTPPSTDVGPVVFYVSGNAGPAGDPGANLTKCHIYTATYTLASQPACPTVPPTISSVQVLQPGLSSQSWVAIKGSNLACTTRFWGSADFASTNMPVQLDDVTVSIDSQAATIEYISPTEIIAWSTDANPTTFAVSNNQGTSATFTPPSQN